jgi:hypothetical protein
MQTRKQAVLEHVKKVLTKEFNLEELEVLDNLLNAYTDLYMTLSAVRIAKILDRNKQVIVAIDTIAEHAPLRTLLDKE